VERVRAELGYPIMVTPLAQFVGSQAALNVITGTRYGTVTDEVIQYALGQWGAEAVEVMDPSVREKILDRPRAAELADRKVSEPTLEEVRRRFGGDLSDEELIACVLAGAGSMPRDLRPPPDPDLDYQGYRSAHRPLLELLRNVASDGEVKRFTYAHGGTRVSVSRN
jgi:oxaloacetate decarboxylase alpha subunit